MSDRLVARVDPVLMPRLLGARAAAWRHLGELETAIQCYDHALEMARSARDLSTEADLLRKKSHVEGDFCRYQEALAMTAVAKQLFEILGDRFGQGRSLIDSGKWFHALGRYLESRRCLTCSLELIPAGEVKYRFAALLGLGFVFKDEGDLRRSNHFAQEAAQFGDKVDPQLLASQSYLLGETALELGDLGKAEPIFLELFGFYSKAGHLLRAGCSLAMAAKAQLISGRNNQAEVTLRSLTSLLGGIPNGTIADVAIVDLLCVLYEGKKVSLDQVNSLLERLKEAAREKPRR